MLLLFPFLQRYYRSLALLNKNNQERLNHQFCQKDICDDQYEVRKLNRRTN